MAQNVCFTLDSVAFERQILTLISHSDPHPPYLPVAATKNGTTCLSRIKNLNVLLNNVRAFYENVLNQILVIRLPDVVQIAIGCNDDLLLSLPNGSELGTQFALPSAQMNGEGPSTALAKNHDASLPVHGQEDARLLLMLILGCAVQCEHKQHFIEQIKQLDIGIQHAIVECIQTITDNPESVFLVSEWSDPEVVALERDRLYSTMVSNICTMTKERAQLAQRVVDLSHELFTLTVTSFNSSNNGLANGHLSTSNSSLNNNSHSSQQSTLNSDQKSHFLVELAEVKSKLRRVQQELEEKNEALVELKEIVEQNKEFCNKLRHDNLELTQEARTAKAYRDEIDVLNERVRKIDRLEVEVQRYRDKMNELEYFKTRVDELREDNRILGETKTMLEEQLESSRKRSEKLPELEEKILKLNAYGNELNLQRELDRNQIDRLIEELGHIRQEKKSTVDELAKVQQELTDLRTQIHLHGSLGHESSREGSLMDQINQDATHRLIKLEHENQKLQNQLADMESSHVDLNSILLLLDMTTFRTVDGHNNREQPGAGGENKSKLEALADIKEAIETLKLTKSKHQNLTNINGELEKELSQLKGQLQDERAKWEALERSHTQSQAELGKYQRIIEQKNKRLEELTSELSAIEAENQMLTANADSLKSSLRKLDQLESDITNVESDRHRLEQEKKSADKEIQRLKVSLEYKDQLLDENAAKLSTLDLENRKLRKDIENIALLGSKLKEAERENKDLTNNLSIQKSTLAALQSDLVGEKLKCQKYADEFDRIVENINKVLAENNLSQETISINGQHLDLSTDFRCIVEKCLQAKDQQIGELESRLAQSTADGDQMKQIIDSMSVHSKSEENPASDSSNALQRTIDHLEGELKQIKTDLAIQKDGHSELAIKHELAVSELTLVQERNGELQNDLVQAQVQNSLLTSQNDSLAKQTDELHEQLATIQDSIEKLKMKCGEYETAHRLLIMDNESLQEIHEQLTADYDNLSETHAHLKQSYKSLKSSHKELEEKMVTLSEQHEQLRLAAAEERDQFKREHSQDQNVEQLVIKLTKAQEEAKALHGEYERLQTEHKMLQNIYKKLRSDNNDLKLKHTELQGETAECKDRMSSLNVDVSKLSSYCQMVAITNATLEKQRKTLAKQSAQLLSQYNEMLVDLTRATECGDKNLCDKLRDLGGKREKLEKLFQEYDVSIEKSMPSMAVNGKHQGKGLDDNIYGRLWESETPSLLYSTNLLRQYSLNGHGGVGSGVAGRSPVKNSPLSSGKFLSNHQAHLYSPQANSLDKVSINLTAAISPRQCPPTPPSTATSSPLPNVSRVSPLVTNNKNTVLLNSSSPATGNTPPASFIRGAYKSSSVNYGSLMQRQQQQQRNLHHQNGSPVQQQFVYVMPQATSVATTAAPVPLAKRATNVQLASPSASNNNLMYRSYQQQQQPPSSQLPACNASDNSLSSSSTTSSSSASCEDHPLNGSCNITTPTSNNNNHRHQPSPLRQQQHQVTPSPSAANLNAINNNGPLAAKEITGNNSSTVTNGPTTNNASGPSNSIWYEYGCV